MGNVDCNDCVQGKLVEKLTERVEKIEQDYVTMRDYEFLKESIQEIKATMKEIVAEIKGIKDKPAQRWDLIVTTVITVFVSSGVTYFITQLAK